MEKLPVMVARLGLIFIALIYLVGKAGLEDTLAKVTEQYAPGLVLLCLLFITVLIHDMVRDVAQHFRDRFMDRLHFKNITRKLKSLGAQEKYLLSLFVDAQRTTQPLDPNDLSVAYLESCRFIFRTQERKDDRFYVYRMSPVAVHILKQNPNWLR
ncbi:super-infection exclusion protein B [Ideonella livida]|uniref:Uncharacterized protein n=1 Tax=Ideonella livida TaxID=2707176 RepID=A0A7C9PF99_9BURK|nr:super-infection exclusion protein B [Ideonella livida]NDY90349.1 hypothetical protein [Ideonella livida]